MRVHLGMDDLLTLADERFVSLTTFRRSGEAVATPIWIAEQGGTLVGITPADSGKLKRLRHTARVELRPCDRRGRVAPGTPGRSGVAEVVEDRTQVGRIRGVIRGKYGVEYRVFMVVEALLRRARHTERVGLRITAAD